MSGLPTHWPAWPYPLRPVKPALPPLPDTPITEYWLVFTTSTQWIREWLRPNFAHCYVLTRDKYNWLVLNPERLHLRAEIAPVAADQDLISMWCKPHETVVKLEFMPRHTTIRFGWGGLFSCVTLVRYLLGLRIKALTPFGLYKKLLSLTEREMQGHRLAKVELIKQGCEPCLKSDAQ